MLYPFAQRGERAIHRLDLASAESRGRGTRPGGEIVAQERKFSLTELGKGNDTHQTGPFSHRAVGFKLFEEMAVCVGAAWGE